MLRYNKFVRFHFALWKRDQGMKETFPQARAVESGLRISQVQLIP